MGSIIIQNEQIFPCSMLSAENAAASKAAVIFGLDEIYAWKVCFDKLHRAIWRSIIYNNDFQIGIGTFIQRSKAFTKNIRAAIMGNHH